MAGESDTIAALSTPAGKGALAVLRISGPSSRSLLERHFSSQGPPRPRRPTLGYITDARGSRIDRVLVTWFPAPASFTGEDVAEISCHGSPLVVAQILDQLLGSGARLAKPGEFTLRAFLNGKMDLVQAEAVRDLIDSQTEYQARLARRQLEGELSHALEPLKRQLIQVCSQLETTLEFVEDEVEPQGAAELCGRIRGVSRELEALAGSFEVGRLVRDGLEVTICGPVNAGKSSLFNALVEQDRAIVTAVPGTTRDAVTETINLGGVPVRLADTAGMRASADPVEVLGVERSRRLVADADLVLFVVDASIPFGLPGRTAWGEVEETRPLLVLNKKDLKRQARIPRAVTTAARWQVEVSALTGEGLKELRGVLGDALAPEGGWRPEGLLITNARHRDCLRRCLRRLEQATAGLEGALSEEFPAYDLRKALDALGEITGETSVEDILQEIFSSFCIGK